jgi:hypothetical protein
MVTVASALALLSVPFTMLVLREPWEYVGFGVLAAALGVYRHRLPLRRLFEEGGVRTPDRSR